MKGWILGLGKRVENKGGKKWREKVAFTAFWLGPGEDCADWLVGSGPCPTCGLENG